MAVENTTASDAGLCGQGIVRGLRHAANREEDGRLLTVAADEIEATRDLLMKWRDEAGALLARCMLAELASPQAAGYFERLKFQNWVNYFARRFFPNCHLWRAE